VEGVKVSVFETAEDVRDADRPALIDLLYRLADDDLVVGHRNSEWTGLAPILEADIAFSSIAQDQIGQARAYYTLLNELGEDGPDTLAFLREADGYRCATLCVLERGDWAFSTVRLYLYESYKAMRLRALCESTYRPLARLARKVQGEQKYHLMHANMWITRMGSATDESRERMQGALDELYGYGLGLFEPTKYDEAIAELGFGPSEETLCGPWREQVEPFLRDCGLEVAGDAEPLVGGRSGRHPAALSTLLESMQQVYRLEPSASW
jgi:ring-1,2-phenylacetyl-CoA epoxidase subunit PaaC